jgi:AcrR family transcriptional regulator
MAMATPRTSKLSRDEIVAVAYDLAEREGLESLSIRTIATSLGVSPMALYRHVATKEEIVDLVVTQILTAEAKTQRWPSAWEDILRLVARRLRDLLHHPVILETVQRKPIAGPHALDGLERLLAAMKADGYDAQTAAGLYSSTVSFVLGHAALQFGRERGRELAGITAKEDRARLAAQLQGLDPARYPQVVAASDVVPGLFDDASFTAGVERLIISVRR